MQGKFNENGKYLVAEQLTQDQKDEKNLYYRWKTIKEKEILEEYVGEPIEKVPEEYREKIARLREFGLGKTTYEEVIEFLETHNGKLMQGSFCEDRKNLVREQLTQEQKDEKNLYSRWRRTKECLILKEYVGEPIEKVPEEYREKIAKLREFGLGLKKSRLKKAKEKRDNAKAQNEKTKVLEDEVEQQYNKKKRGQTYGE